MSPIVNLIALSKTMSCKHTILFLFPADRETHYVARASIASPSELSGRCIVNSNDGYNCVASCKVFGSLERNATQKHHDLFLMQSSRVCIFAAIAAWRAEIKLGFLIFVVFKQEQFLITDSLQHALGNFSAINACNQGDIK